MYKTPVEDNEQKLIVNSNLATLDLPPQLTAFVIKSVILWSFKYAMVHKCLVFKLWILLEDDGILTNRIFIHMNNSNINEQS